VLGDDTDGQQDLRDYLRVLRRHRVLIALTVAAAVGLSLVGAYLQTPVYAASARLLIQPRPGISLFEATNGQGVSAGQFVATEIEVIKGEPVQEEVRRRLGSTPSISVRPVGTTSVVTVVAESTDPEKAAAVANAYVDAYIAIRRQQGIDESLTAQKEVQGQIVILQGRIHDLDAQIGSAQGSVADSLQAQRQSQLQQQALFKQTLDQQQVNMALITGGAQVVRSAAVPSSPIRPLPGSPGLSPSSGSYRKLVVGRRRTGPV